MYENWVKVFDGLQRALSQKNVVKVDLGFNAFSLMSDIYHRENFFSDVIKEILNPEAKHGQGAAFLRLFIEYLVKVCEVRANEGIGTESNYAATASRLKEIALPANLDDAVLYREENKIDIKIYHPHWTILIENKINNACDMDRQIPRYVEKCREKKENVIAVVYLKPHDDNAFPAGLEGKDIDMVRGLLIPIAGYSPGSSSPDLVTGWLDGCILAAQQFDAKCVMGQFSKLIMKQAGDVMDKNQMDAAYEAFKNKKLTYTELSDFVCKLPRYLASKLVDDFKNKRTRFTDPFVWDSSKRAGVVAVLNGFIPENLTPSKVCLALDINCTPVRTGDKQKIVVSFFERENGEQFSIKDYADEFKDIGFRLDEQDGRLHRDFDADEVYADVTTFISDIRAIVNKIVSKEKIFAVATN